VEPATAARSVSSRETDGRAVESAADDRTPGQTDEASTGRTLLALHTHTQRHTCLSLNTSTQQKTTPEAEIRLRLKRRVASQPVIIIIIIIINRFV